MQFPLGLEDLVNLLHLAYRSARDVIQFILENTLVKANPALAAEYADVMTLLATLTALFLILEFVTSAKKVLASIVTLGWVFLIASMIITLSI